MRSEAGKVRFFRIGFVLQAVHPIALAPHQAATIHALLCAAYGRGNGENAGMPEGLMLDAPEQCRTRVAARETYSFGCTLLAETGAQAGALVSVLSEGLRRVGREKSQGGSRPKFAGNFLLSEVRDLIADRAMSASDTPAPVALDRISAEQARAREASRLTLRFSSPLRMLRPAAAREPGHHWFDESFFDGGLFALRALQRLDGLGLASAPDEVSWVYRSCDVIENRLTWLDIAYGPASRRKVLGGVVGRVILKCDRAEVADALVMGQYARLGQSTRFGFGAYRIEELGGAPDATPRTTPLLASYLKGQDLTGFADEMDLPSGALRQAAKLLARGEYKPCPHARVPIQQPDGKTRVLAIPAPLDRALQRAVLSRLAPALDGFFEESSTAYRKGLGRHRAADRLRDAFRRGFRFALKSDFRSFFDSIDHERLRDRLEAYLADDHAVDAIMKWVAAGAPFEGRGLPTGAPLSPLLANLFLDAFDEEVERDGGRLVRYADDFLILFRDAADADRVFKEARSSADSLLLSLNESKTNQIDLRAPFEFLGFRFQCLDRWSLEPLDSPRRVEDLGWRQAVRRPEQPNPAPLPGESETANAESRSWIVFGPGASTLRSQEGRLLCSYRAATGETSVALDQVREMLVLGGATITGAALREVLTRDIRLILADDAGRLLGEVAPAGLDPDPDAVRAQLAMNADVVWRLALARRLSRAKICNYAFLADASRGPGDPAVGPGLRELAARVAAAKTIGQLLGIEGAAAARWYRWFGSKVPHWCRFAGRVAPNAEDPANILLNLAQTALHRQALLAVRMAGLLPGAGILHEPRPGHASLASDLQEPFRHLMDRAVFAILPTLKPGDFTPTPEGPYRVAISPNAARRAVALIHATFAQPCRSAGQPEAYTYLTWLILTARGLRRHLLDRSVVFEPFVHPEKP